jgi:heat shock protein HslJ
VRLLLVVPFALAGLLIAGCSNRADADEPSPDDRTFVSVAVDGEQIPGGGPLTLGFADGQISAYAGCNHGAGAVDLADGHLVTRLAITNMACSPPVSDADGWMSRLLEADPAWALVDDTLTLTTDATTVTLRDKKVVDPDRPLAGTTWLVDSLVSDDAVMTSAALELARPTLTITTDGTVTGWTGCNQFNGRAIVSGTGDTVEFGPIATTRMACVGDAGEIEQSVLRVLDGTVAVAIDADQLRLTGANGHGLVLRAQ